MITRQEFIEQFVHDLHCYATGSYLRETDKEFWEQPFDPQVLPELKALLERFLSDVANLTAGDAVTRAVTLIHDLNAFNRRHADAVIEPEEEEELTTFIQDVLYERGVDEEMLKTLPEFE